MTNPQAFNHYSYVYNSPLEYVDLDGHEPTPWFHLSLFGNQAAIFSARLGTYLERISDFYQNLNDRNTAAVDEFYDQFMGALDVASIGAEFLLKALASALGIASGAVAFTSREAKQDQLLYRQREAYPRVFAFTRGQQDVYTRLQGLVDQARSTYMGGPGGGNWQLTIDYDPMDEGLVVGVTDGTTYHSIGVVYLPWAFDGLGGVWTSDMAAALLAELFRMLPVGTRYTADVDAWYGEYLWESKAALLDQLSWSAIPYDFWRDSPHPNWCPSEWCG